MKKKFRTITVNGIIYGWTVCGDYERKVLFIWSDKQIIHRKEIKCDFEDNKITPKIVRTVILEMLSNKNIK